MKAADGWLPELVTLEEFGGDWEQYLCALYEFFCIDFIDSTPAIHGKRFALKRHPLLAGKEATFWHFISEGKKEDERIPDLRRCERIRWPRPIIEAYAGGALKWWISDQHRGECRIVIALNDFSYIVVLADRGEYVLPWTAYCVDREHRRRKLQRDYEAFCRNQKG